MQALLRFFGSVDDGIGVVDGLHLDHLVGPAGLAVQGPAQLLGGGELDLGRGERRHHGVEDGGVGHQQGAAEFLHVFHVPDGGDEGHLQQAVGEVRVSGGGSC